MFHHHLKKMEGFKMLNIMYKIDTLYLTIFGKVIQDLWVLIFEFVKIDVYLYGSIHWNSSYLLIYELLFRLVITIHVGIFVNSMRHRLGNSVHHRTESQRPSVHGGRCGVQFVPGKIRERICGWTDDVRPAVVRVTAVAAPGTSRTAGFVTATWWSIAGVCFVTGVVATRWSISRVHVTVGVIYWLLILYDVSCWENISEYQNFSSYFNTLVAIAYAAPYVL